MSNCSTFDGCPQLVRVTSEVLHLVDPKPNIHSQRNQRGWNYSNWISCVCRTLHSRPSYLPTSACMLPYNLNNIKSASHKTQINSENWYKMNVYAGVCSYISQTFRHCLVQCRAIVQQMTNLWYQWSHDQ